MSTIHKPQKITILWMEQPRFVWVKSHWNSHGLSTEIPQKWCTETSCSLFGWLSLSLSIHIFLYIYMFYNISIKSIINLFDIYIYCVFNILIQFNPITLNPIPILIISWCSKHVKPRGRSRQLLRVHLAPREAQLRGCRHGERVARPSGKGGGADAAGKVPIGAHKDPRGPERSEDLTMDFTELWEDQWKIFRIHEERDYHEKQWETSFLLKGRI